MICIPIREKGRHREKRRRHMKLDTEDGIKQGHNQGAPGAPRIWRHQGKISPRAFGASLADTLISDFWCPEQ